MYIGCFPPCVAETGVDRPSPLHDKPVSVGIAGVSGYVGVELLRLLLDHPGVQITDLSGGRSAGKPLTDSWPGVAGLTDLLVENTDAARMADRCDLVFLALPHGLSAEIAADLVSRGVKVIDLGADFRLRDPAYWLAAYCKPHAFPALNAQAVYGLPELLGAGAPAALAAAPVIACAGCYPTATTLAALPLVEAGLVDWISATCVSGISGAGRAPSDKNLYCEVQESAEPYKLAGAHRHTPEMEQSLGVPVTFSPHIVPMRRGMLSTVTARLKRPVDPAEMQALYGKRYAGHPLVQLRDVPPATRDVRGTGRAHVHVAVDVNRQAVTAVCAIDNLGKGAAAQAVQCMNLALGFPETAWIPRFPLVP